MLIHDCIPCQYGDHDDCMGVYEPPPGVMGGAMCGCKGDCAERYATEIARRRASTWDVLFPSQEVRLPDEED